jgi:hypothetical protein
MADKAFAAAIWKRFLDFNAGLDNYTITFYYTSL